jgi:hypothetical protein
MTIEKDEAMTLLEQDEKNLTEQIKKHGEELKSIKETLGGLKQKLYGKFGTSVINLEDEDE